MPEVEAETNLEQMGTELWRRNRPKPDGSRRPGGLPYPRRSKGSWNRCFQNTNRPREWRSAADTGLGCIQLCRVKLLGLSNRLRRRLWGSPILRPPSDSGSRGWPPAWARR